MVSSKCDTAECALLSIPKQLVAHTCFLETGRKHGWRSPQSLKQSPASSSSSLISRCTKANNGTLKSSLVPVQLAKRSTWNSILPHTRIRCVKSALGTFFIVRRNLPLVLGSCMASGSL